MRGNSTLILILSLSLVGPFLTACSPNRKAADPTTKKDAAATLADKTYALTVEQQWDKTTAEPAAERKYIPSGAGKEYTVVFAADQAEVTITQPDLEKPVLGRRTRNEPNLWSYRLKEWLFAGGELGIRLENGRLQAQFDVLGSGTPLISSERGPLTEKSGK